MSVISIVFSPTGATARAAELLAKHLGPQGRTIDLTENKDFAAEEIRAEDVCVIAAPAYGGRMPVPAAQRLAMLGGNGARAVLVATFGNRAIDDTLLEMQEVAVQAGFVPVAGVEAVTEHCLARKFGAGRPDDQDAAELADFTRRIAARLAAGEERIPELPGKRPFKEFKGTPAKPVAGDSCGLCGLCAARCPAGAIPAENPRATENDKCISCMRCVEICPQGARQVNPAVKAALALALGAVCGGRKENRLWL